MKRLRPTKHCAGRSRTRSQGASKFTRAKFQVSKWREQEWVRFLDMMGNVFPKPLPRRLRDTQFIYFDKLFNPIEMGSQGIFGNPLLAVLRSKGLVT